MITLGKPTMEDKRACRDTGVCEMNTPSTYYTITILYTMIYYLLYYTIAYYIIL